jgi:hypothetical protein
MPTANYKKAISIIKEELPKIETITEKKKAETKLLGLSSKIIYTIFKGRPLEDKEELISELSDMLNVPS